MDAPTQDRITLKWGTIKGWNIHNKKSQEILRKYLDIGVSMSAMAQKDTPEQKEILCELIRQHDGEIYNDWDGKDYSKEQAISYIQDYGT